MKFMGTKEGMMQVLDDRGNPLPCTVIKIEKHVVSQVKILEIDHYQAVQVASLELKGSKVKKCPKPQLGHFKKAGINPHRVCWEFRISGSDAVSYQVGDEISIELFQKIPFVDVMGTSKGKGFQGVMKRYHFSGGPASHGSGFHRHGGSCGMRSTPGRCLPGQKKAGRMGGEQATVENLQVIGVRPKEGLLLVKGGIPGSCGSMVYVTIAKKKQAQIKNRSKKSRPVKGAHGSN